MYKNVGKKIQSVAKIVAWIGIILSVLLGIFCILYGIKENEQYFFNGVFLLLFGPLTCWISSLTLFGFGKLIEDNENMKAQLDVINKQIQEIKK